MRKLAITAGIVSLWLGLGPASAQKFQADSGISVISTQVANNTTAIIISNQSASLYQIEAFNNGATIAYIKLYNAGSIVTGAPAAVTCGSGTPRARYMIPASTGNPVVIPIVNGDAYVYGITMCVTTGYADNDTGSPTASEYIVNIHFK